jgi:hypothetical protein
MPSQQTAKRMIKCEVLRGIGMPPDKKTLKTAEERARRKDIKFDPSGLTTMVYPNKDTYEDNGKTVIEAEPVFVELDEATAKKLQKVNAVRVAI